MWKVLGGEKRGKAAILPSAGPSSSSTLPGSLHRQLSTSITVKSYPHSPRSEHSLSIRPKPTPSNKYQQFTNSEEKTIENVSLVKIKTATTAASSTTASTTTANASHDTKRGWQKYLPESWQVPVYYNALGQSDYEVLMFFRPSIRLFHIFITIVLTSINIRMIFYPLASHSTMQSNELLPMLLYVLVSLLHIVMLWTTKIIKNYAFHRWETVQQTIPFPFIWLDDCSVVLSSMCFSFCMLLLTICDQSSGSKGGYLDGERGLGFFNEMLFYTMMVPLILQLSLLSRRFVAAICSWFISSLSCVLAIAFNRNMEPLPLILFFMIISGLTFIVYLYDELHRKEMLFMHKSLQTTLSSNSEITEEVQRKQQDTVDMRHMIANTAHDMKTPLAATMNGCEIVIDLMEKLLIQHVEDFDVGKDIQDCIETLGDITNTSRFMVASINRCLDYAKLSDGVKLVPRLETCNVYDILKVTMHCLSSVSDRDKVKISNLPMTMCPYIITDTQWLQENVLCLVSNAVKFCPNGGIEVRLFVQEVAEVTSCGDGGGSSGGGSSVNRDMVCVEVEDHGVGISKDMQCKLFEPFQQAQRHAGGTGLGLFSLSKRIEALNGKFGVGNRKDGKRGSLFWFTFPYRPDEEVANMAAVQQSRNDYDLQQPQQQMLTLGSMSSHGSIRNLSEEMEAGLEVLSCPTSARALPVTSTTTSISISGLEPRDRAMSMDSIAEDNINAEQAVQKLVSHLTASTLPSLQTIISPRRISAAPAHRNSTSSQLTSSMIQPTPRSSMSPLGSISVSTKSNEKPFQRCNPYLKQSLRTKKPLYVLLVDDSQPIQKMTSKLLQQEGHVVCSALNGLDALTLLAQCDTYPMLDIGEDDDNGNSSSTLKTPPKTSNGSGVEEKLWCYFDLIIMDLNMPVMDGLECTRRIRSHERQQRQSSSYKKRTTAPLPSKRDVMVLRNSLMLHQQQHLEEFQDEATGAGQPKAISSDSTTTTSSSSTQPVATRFPFLELMRNTLQPSSTQSSTKSLNLARSSTSSHIPTQRYSISTDIIPEDEQHVISLLRNFSIDDEEDDGASAHLKKGLEHGGDGHVGRLHPTLSLIKDGSDQSIISRSNSSNDRAGGYWHQRIIGCSANDDEETIQETMHAGADTFIRKPFKLDAFYQVLELLDESNTPIFSQPPSPGKQM